MPTLDATSVPQSAATAPPVAAMTAPSTPSFLPPRPAPISTPAPAAAPAPQAAPPSPLAPANGSGNDGPPTHTPELPAEFQTIVDGLNVVQEYEALGWELAGSIQPNGWALVVDRHGTPSWLHVSTAIIQVPGLPKAFEQGITREAVRVGKASSIEAAREMYQKKAAAKVEQPAEEQPTAQPVEDEAPSTEVTEPVIAPTAPAATASADAPLESFELDGVPPFDNDGVPFDTSDPLCHAIGDRPDLDRERYQDYIEVVRCQREVERKARRAYDLARLRWEEAVRELTRVIDYGDGWPTDPPLTSEADTATPKASTATRKPATAGTAPTKEEQEAIETARIPPHERPLADVRLDEIGIAAGICRTLAEADPPLGPIRTLEELSRATADADGQPFVDWAALNKVKKMGPAKTAKVEAAVEDHMQKRQPVESD